MVRKAIILCGGVSTRFLPVSKSVCKEMLPILNRPVIDYAIQDLKNNGISFDIIEGYTDPVYGGYYIAKSKNVF